VNIVEATRSYERWLAEQIPLVQADLRLKHERMGESLPGFLRATYYRWAQRFSELLPELAAAPAVLAVGDLHLENFGTWRDRSGRIVWGVNDYDEAERLPYVNDLVRLGTSALVAAGGEHLSLHGTAICDLILAGYRQRLEDGAGPVVFGVEHRWLKHAVNRGTTSGVEWWNRLRALPAFEQALPREARSLLDTEAPTPDWTYTLHTRVAGLGSLGHRRVVAIGPSADGPEARELKQLSPPAGAWLGLSRIEADLTLHLGQHADPILARRGGWQRRRLAPECRKLDLAAYGGKQEQHILHAMGYQTASAHLAVNPASRDAITEHVTRFTAGDLREAIEEMARHFAHDHTDYSQSKGR